MRKNLWRFGAILTSVAAVSWPLALAGCEDSDPMEDTADTIGDTAEDAAEGAEDAVEETGDAFEDATD